MTAGRGPGLRKTTVGDLVVPLVVVGITVYVLLRFSYDSLPPLNYAIALPIAALAGIELWIARRVRAAVRHDPDAKPMQAITIARCVALGKATCLVGSGVVGAALGFLGRTLPDVTTLSAADHDARVAAVMALAASALVVAGLVLERAGIDPGSDARPGRGVGQRL